MKIKTYSKFQDYLLLNTDKGKIRLLPYSESIIRITYTLNKDFINKKSLMIVPQDKAPVFWNVVENGENLVFLTNKLRVIISREKGAFVYMDKNGEMIAREPEKGGKTLIPTNIYKTVFDEGTDIEINQGVDGIRASKSNTRKVFDRKSFHSKLEFVWGENEALYGLGSHEEGIMNLRGHQQYLYQHNMKAVVPVLVSTNGYGILVDSYSLMTFHDDVYGSYLWTEYCDEMDYYFIYGPEFDTIVSGIRMLTGKAPMLPKWAFGYIQSKERYKSQEELISVVKEYRERQIPLDVIVLDWMSWPGELWGEKKLDPERFPDPKGMMDELHSLNARLMVSIWPIMRNGGDNHEEMQKKGYLLGNQTTYDAFNEKARELYWEQANKGLFSHGIDAWWCDCTEPFEADWNGEYKYEPEQRLAINTDEAKKYLDPEYINAYSLLHSKGIYEGQRKVTDKKRVVNLTRSSYAGQHRYSTITWSGDISANWETLRKQIPGGLNFCITGEPYWTTDIGAFFVKRREDLWFWDGHYNNGCEDLGYKELYVRWFQYGTFLPIFRSHGTDTPREVWRFGEPGSIFYDTLVKFINLRYRLLPYIYSLAGMVTHMDYTMLRALAFDFRQDPNVYDISDQYMFGPALMVCPVTKPMYFDVESRPLEGVKKTRPVYLPAGSDWYDFWTGERFTGGRTINANATLDIIPLYVRSGSILPMGPFIQHTGEIKNADLELRIYPGTDGEFNLYEDSGDGYDYEKGEYAITRISWDDRNRTLSFGERVGAYTGMPENTKFRIVLVSKNTGIGLTVCNNSTNRLTEYTGKSITVNTDC